MEQLQKIIQDTDGGLVTINEGEVPVIKATEQDLSTYVPAIVNFLRSGCPSVQLFDHYHSNEPLVPLRRVLKKLQIGTERFSVSGKHPVFLFSRTLLERT